MTCMLKTLRQISNLIQKRHKKNKKVSRGLLSIFSKIYLMVNKLIFSAPFISISQTHESNFCTY